MAGTGSANPYGGLTSVHPEDNPYGGLTSGQPGSSFSGLTQTPAQQQPVEGVYTITAEPDPQSEGVSFATPSQMAQLAGINPISSQSSPVPTFADPSSSAGAGFSIQPQAVQDVSNNFSSTISDTSSVTTQLGAQSLDPTAFGGIGSSVGAANTQLQSTLTSGLGSLVQLLSQVNGLVSQSAQNYTSADSSVAQSYGGITQPQTPTTRSITQPTTPTSGATPLTPAQLAQDGALRSRIMREEDPHDGTPLNQVYVDTQGHPTVGHGFNLDQAGAARELASVGANYQAVRNGTEKLTDDQINQLFNNHVNIAVSTAQNYFSGFDQLDPARQRVLTDMAFNMGGATLGQFHGLHQALVNGDYNSAANHMASSLWARQVGGRAQVLTRAMRTGTGY